MNTLVIISFLAMSPLFFEQNEDSEILTLTYHHGIKLDKIPEPGSRFVFKQFCFTTIDSVISSGNIIHEHSKIGKIKDCDFQWQIREDTLRAVIIKTSKEKNTKQVIRQATEQFGKPKENNDNQNSTYEWIMQKDKSKVRIELIIDVQQKTSKLTVTK